MRKTLWKSLLNRRGKRLGRLPGGLIFGAALVAMLGLLWSCETAEVPPTETASEGRPPEVRPEIWPEVESAVAPDPEVEAAVEELLASLTLEEKVGQVIQAEIRHVTPEDVRKYRLGSVLNGGGSHPEGDKSAAPEKWLALADAFYEASMDTSDGGHAIPILWGVDAVHGHNNVVGATFFPHNIALGATRDAELVREIGEITAREVAVTGLDWTFAPTVAVARDDRWGRAYESYSEDPELVARLGAAMVEGLQGVASGEDFLGPDRVLATAKHFLGDGGTHLGIDQGDNQATEEELRDVHGAGYVTTIEAGVQTVMASFNSWHGKKLHGNKGLLTGVLKGRMGFDGIVVGDWNGHGQVSGCTNASCAPALNAGVDLFMVPENWRELYENTFEQVRSGEISAERLDDAVRRILRVKMRAGLFERGKPSVRELAGQVELLGAPEHRAVARQAVRESLVLLKNDTGVLPLDPSGRLLVAGDAADDIAKQNGGWTLTWQGTGNTNADFPGATSIGAGIRAAAESAGGSVEISPDGSFSERPDAAIVVFGEDPYAEMRGDLETLEYRRLRGEDLELLKRLHGEGIPVVSIFLSGRPLWVNPELNASDAFVAAWWPGTEGAGIAEVILRGADGEIAHDFRGKLSFSWPRTPDQAVLHDAGAALFPYGYGLTYGETSAVGELSEEVATESVVSRRVYFDGGAVAPWSLRIVDGEGAVVTVAEAAATPSGVLAIRPIDREVQEDARALTFSGEGRAVAEMTAAAPIDLEREKNAAMALGFAVRIDTAPSGAIELSMGCGDECAGTVDLQATLAELSVGEWHHIAVSLDCFAEAGADLTRIDTPFRLATADELGLSFADVELVEGGEATCP